VGSLGKIKFVPFAKDVEVTPGELIVTLEDARVIHVPLHYFPRLDSGTPDQRNNWELIGKGHGIHWEELDEDISVASLLGLESD
jgi:hypothetical protein